jgi:hypothetical protein
VGAAIHREGTICLRGRPQAREEGEERDCSQEGSLESKEVTTSGGGRRGPVTTTPEEKEDTVESVTMINGAMLSTLMLMVKIRQPSHEFTFGVGISFIPYPLVLTPVV